MIARKVCLHAGLIAVMSACVVTNGKGDTSGLGISDDATVGFVWSANSEPDLAGYKLYVGTLPGIYSGYVDVGPATSFQLFDLIPGTTYHFALTAYNSGGLESDFTPELTKQVPLVITNGVFTLDPALTNSPAPIDLSGITNTTISPETLPLEVTRIPDQRVAKNGISDSILFSVSGMQISEHIELIAVSSNPSVLPSDGLILAGSDGDYILIIDPTNGRTGVSIVTIAVSDGEASTSVSFQVTVASEGSILPLDVQPIPLIHGEL